MATKENKVEEDIEEINNLVSNMNLYNIPPWLKNCESPFIWHTKLKRAYPSEYTIEQCVEKLDELNLDELNFSLRRITLLARLIVEYIIQKNEDKVKEMMKTIEQNISRFSEEQDPHYERFKLISAHVISTTKAHLLSLEGQDEESKKIADTIMPMDQMSQSNKAGLCAMKAHFFIWAGYENAENVAVNLAREALKFEPEHPDWLFLLAKMLREKRRSIPFNDEIPEEELSLLKTVVEQSERPKYLLYTAQIYREFATQTLRKHRKEKHYCSSDLYQKMEDMHCDSLYLYKKALDITPNDPVNLRRIGYGIMNLPENIANYNLAIQCLLKSLELCYNFNTLHMIGTFYHRYRYDNKKALEYYEKTANAGSFVGLCDFIRVKYTENPDNYNPCDDIDKGLQREIKTKHRLFLLSQKCGYFLFIKRDFLQSIDYFLQAISEDEESKHLTVFKCSFLFMYDTINLYHYMANESLLYLQQNKSYLKEKNKNDNMHKVEAFFDQITKINPELKKIDPDPFLIDKLCESSKENVYQNKKRAEKHKSRSVQHEQKSYFQGCQSRFQPMGRRDSSGSREAENFDNWRTRPTSGNQRTNEYKEERSARLSGNSKESGYYRPNNIRKESGLRSDEDFNWRRK